MESVKEKTQEEIVKELFKDQNVFKFHSVTAVNHKPHPYMITERHIGYAHDNCSGMLGEYTIEAAEKSGIKCGFKGCHLSYKEHTCDTVIFLSLLKDIKGSEATEILKPIVKEVEKMKIDGFAFIKSDFKFLPDEQTTVHPK